MPVDPVENESTDTAQDSQDVADPTFEETILRVSSIYQNKVGEIGRLRSFLEAMYLNASHDPAHMTGESVAFFAHAALHGYSISRAFDKWEALTGRKDLDDLSPTVE